MATKSKPQDEAVGGGFSIHDAVMQIPQLCGLTERQVVEVRAAMEHAWQRELEGVDHQRKPSQSVRERIQPGFDWVRRFDQQWQNVVAEYAQLWVEWAGLNVDKNNKVPFDAVRLAKVDNRLNVLASFSATIEARKVMPIDPSLARTLDYWN